MIFNDFQGKRLPMLGFGAMRLPVIKTDTGDEIDLSQTEKMVELAMASGVNYFDTAYPYHGGKSEIVMGELLRKYPRESYYLADKYPGHQLRDEYRPSEVFEDQLKKCGVDYFDFYLLHNVNEKSMEVYLDPKWGIIDYFKEQKRQGRIKHLGFSTHATAEGLEEFLSLHGKDMEFCQIQLNYLDYKLQNAKRKVELLREHQIPIWVMEPLRGGRIVNLPEYEVEGIRRLSPSSTAVSLAFRWLMGIEGVDVILSGMSSMEQLRENISIFASKDPTSEEENRLLSDIADRLMSAVPCTGCRYCTDGCPMGLDIPMLISVYNEMKYAKTVNAAMRVEFLPDDKKPQACIACGKCRTSCPQNIDIPTVLYELSEMMREAPSWKDICKKRNEEERALKGE